MSNVKFAIMKAKVDGILTEILVKTQSDYVYMMDGTTTLTSKLAEMMTAISTKAEQADVETAIANLKKEILGNTPVEAYDTLQEIGAYLESHEDAYTALVELVGDKATTATVEALAERVTALEGEMTAVKGRVDAVESKLSGVEAGAQVNKLEKVKVNGVEQTITDKAVDIKVPTGALASKDTVTESDVDSTLMEKINSSAQGNHSHSNKALLDTYTQTEANLADAVSKKHSHDNKAVLDGITSDKVVAWDASEQNAKDFATTEIGKLSSVYDAKGSAATAEGNAKSYTDEAVEGLARIYVQANEPADMTANDILFQIVQ